MFKPLVALFCALTLFGGQALASSSGPNLPGTAASTGSPPWTTPDNSKNDNGTGTTCSYVSNIAGGTLKDTNFGFSLGAGVTSIDGIEVALKGKASNANRTIKDSSLKLTKDNSTTVGSDKADTSTAWGTSYATITYGSSSDLWGTSWNQSEVEASTFGAWFVSQSTAGSGVTAADVDFVKITIYYTAGGAAAVQSRTLMGVGK